MIRNLLLSVFLVINTTVSFSQDEPVRKIKVYLPAFNTYKTDDIYTGKAATVDFKSCPKMKLYRTMIRHGYKRNRLNFAGHYSFVEWGCGSDCRESVIIDLEDGKIYDAPTSSRGCSFRKNSLMVIVNPPPKDHLLNDYMMATTPEVWVLNAKTKKFKQKKVRFYPKPHFGPRKD